MPTTLFVPKDPANTSLGGTIEFLSDNWPVLQPGDEWTIDASGLKPGRIHCGWLMPYEYLDVPEDPWPHYRGAVNSSGELRINGVAPVAWDMSRGLGIGLATGVLPPGGTLQIVFTDYHFGQYVPAGPPPTPPEPGFPYLISLVKASRTTHVPVADWIADADRNVMYTYAPPYAVTPFIVNLAWSVCLTDVASARIAAALGGTVVKEPPPVWADPFVAPGTAPPLVNYIHAVKDGVPVKALAQEVAQSFNGDLDNSIPAVFKAV